MKTSVRGKLAFSLEFVRYALVSAGLFGVVSPGIATEIYVATNTGTFGSPATLERVYKYTVSGSVATPSSSSPLITAFNTFFPTGNFAVSESRLYFSRGNPFPSANDHIDVFSATTGASLNVPLITSPFLVNIGSVAVSGSLLFTSFGNVIQEYNANSGVLVKANLVGGPFPQGLAVFPGPAGVVNLFVVSNNSGAAGKGTGAIYKYAVSGGVATPSTPSPLVSGLNFPTSVALSPNGSKLFVIQDGPAPPPFLSDRSKSTISEYDANTGASVAAPLVTGLKDPTGVAADSSYLYVTLGAPGTVSQYNINTGKVVKAPLVSGLSFTTAISVGPAARPLYSTGVDALCVSLSSGTIDPHWQMATPYPSASSAHVLVDPENPPLTFGSVYTATNDPAWIPSSSSSAWITPTATASQQVLGGQYVYRTTFENSGTLSGRYSSDNELLAVYLNGVLTTFPLNGGADFGTWTNFTLPVLPSGPNTLDFVVRNRGAGGIDSNSTVSGLRVEFALPCPVVHLKQLTVQASGLAYSRVNQTFSGTVKVENSSLNTVSGPIQLLLTSLPAGVTLANSTGTFDESPFITVPVTSLAPGETTAVNVIFRNPSNARINFTPKIYSGSF